MSFASAVVRRLPLTLLVIVCGVGCTKQKKTAAKAEISAAVTKRLEADAKAVEESWILELARNPKALSDLAEKSEGWRFLFQNKPFEALKVFERFKRRPVPTGLVGHEHARSCIARTPYSIVWMHWWARLWIKLRDPDLMRTRLRAGAVL